MTCGKPVYTKKKFSIFILHYFYTMVNKERKFASLAVVCTVLLLMVCLYFFIYPIYQQYFPKCIFHSLTGLYCPGCGVQRAISSLLHGNIILALRDNFLVVALLPFIANSFRILFLDAFSEKYLNHLKFYSPAFQKTFLVIVIIFGVIRNIPVHPFDLFAPL